MSCILCKNFIIQSKDNVVHSYCKCNYTKTDAKCLGFRRI
jgi:hypothetical protein